MIDMNETAILTNDEKAKLGQAMNLAQAHVLRLLEKKDIKGELLSPDQVCQVAEPFVWNFYLPWIEQMQVKSAREKKEAINKVIADKAKEAENQKSQVNKMFF